MLGRQFPFQKGGRDHYGIIFHLLSKIITAIPHVTQIRITWFPLAHKNPLLTETNNAIFGSGGHLGFFCHPPSICDTSPHYIIYNLCFQDCILRPFLISPTLFQI